MFEEENYSNANIHLYALAENSLAEKYFNFSKTFIEFVLVPLEVIQSNQFLELEKNSSVYRKNMFEHLKRLKMAKNSFYKL